MSSREMASRAGSSPYRTSGPAQLPDVLERILDKGIVVAGDIQINLLDIELLTIKLRLLIASADKAREMGIDWWQNDPFLKSGRRGRELDTRLRRLEEAAGLEVGDGREQTAEDSTER